MPDYSLPAGAGLAQGFASGLFRGLEMQERRAEFAQQAEERRLALTLKGLDFLEQMAYVPPELQPHYERTLKDWFLKATGQELDPGIMGALRTTAKTQGETLANMIPGVKEMVTSGQVRPEQVSAIMGGKLGPAGFLTIAKMYQDAQSQKTLGELLQPILRTEQIDVAQFKTRTPEEMMQEAERRYRAGAALPQLTGPHLEALKRGYEEERTKAWQAWVNQRSAELRRAPGVASKSLDARSVQQQAISEAQERFGFIPTNTALMMAQAERPLPANKWTAYLSHGAQLLGLPVDASIATNPDITNVALAMAQADDLIRNMPKGAENFQQYAVLFGDIMRQRLPGMTPEKVQEAARRAFSVRFGLAAAAKAGGLEAELTPSGTLPTFPGTPATPQGAPAAQGAPSGQPAPPPPSRRAAVSEQAQAGEVAKVMQQFSVVRAYIEEIDALSKPLITAQKAPASWWQAAQVAGVRVTNYDQLAKYYEERKEAFLGSMSRTVGAQVGVLTQMDVDSMRRLFPTAGNTMAQREAKINSLKALVRINQQAHKARLTSGGELPEVEYVRYRQAIDAEIAKMEGAAGTNRQPGSGTATDFFRKYGITPGRR